MWSLPTLKQINIATLFVLGLLAVGVYAQDKPVPAKEERPVKEEKGPQVVLTVLKKDNGKTYVTTAAKKVVVIFSLLPLSGETVRAAQQGDSMVCHMHDVKGKDGVLHIAFSCGPDTYVMEGVAVAEKK